LPALDFELRLREIARESAGAAPRFAYA